MRFAGDAQFAGDELAQLRRHLAVELDADHRAAAAALQRGLEQAHQILGLFLDLDIAVADDAERAGALDLVAGEQLADEQADRLFERDEADTRALRSGRRMKRFERRRQAQQRRHLLAVLAVAQLQRHREAEIGDERERMRRVDRQRRQHRKDLLLEMVFQPGPLVLGQSIGRATLSMPSWLEQYCMQAGKALLLVLLQPLDFVQQSVRAAVRACARRGCAWRCPRAPGRRGRRRAP